MRSRKVNKRSRRFNNKQRKLSGGSNDLEARVKREMNKNPIRFGNMSETAKKAYINKRKKELKTQNNIKAPKPKSNPKPKSVKKSSVWSNFSKFISTTFKK
jgi:hypothetical protein